jgi:hypothetical protein
VKRLPILAGVLVTCALVGAASAWAASLLISPKPLTVFAYCIVRASAADSYVVQNSSAANFGTGTTVLVRSQSASRNRRTFVRFDLTSCNARTSAVVSAATLSLYLSTAPTASRTYDVRPVSAAWTETGVTWTNQPAVGAITSSTATGTTSGVRLAWTVTADVQAWLAGTATNDGFRVSDAAESSATSREGTFRAREFGTAGQRPQLTIMYYPQ